MTRPATPHPLQIPPVEEPLILAPMDRPPTLGASLETLLRRPGSIVHELREGNRTVLGWLVVTAAVSLLLFGLLLGAFSGGVQWIASPLKVLGGALASAVICLPSFYVFSCLGGADMQLRAAVGLLAALVALVGVILVAFGPVVWLFSQATDAAGFIGFLALVAWVLGLAFAFRMVFRAARAFGVTNRGHLVLWFGLFVLVTLQMSTSLRPLVGKADTVLPTEKRFFIEHWAIFNSSGGN